MNKNGQSIVEYILIAILVIFGIYFAGPYLLRSIGAHFKLWDEGVRDSFEEHLSQADMNAVPPIYVNCQCSAQAGSCGDPNQPSSNPASGCAPNERTWSYTCNIQGCYYGNSNYPSLPACQPDPTCCTTLTAGSCGYLPMNAVQTNPITNCYYGQRMWSSVCGNNTNVSCRPDPSCPLPQCQGYVPYPGSTIYCATGTATAPNAVCPIGTSAPTCLTQNTNNYYVGNEAADCSSVYGVCAVYCAPGYVVNDLGTACVPPPPSTYVVIFKRVHDCCQVPANGTPVTQCDSTKSTPKIPGDKTIAGLVFCHPGDKVVLKKNGKPVGKFTGSSDKSCVWLGTYYGGNAERVREGDNICTAYSGGADWCSGWITCQTGT